MNELKQFDKLSADITVFVAPALKIQVADQDSSQSAINVVSDIKGYLNAVEKKRKELVGPLNEQVKLINDYCKQITAPLNNADTHVRGQINAFATKQLEIKRIEEARLKKEQEEAERIAKEERDRIEAELIAKQDAEAEAHVDSVTLFGAENGDVDEAHKEIEAKQDQEWAEKQAELQREEAIRKAEFQQRQFDVGLTKVKNTRVKLECKVVDLALVPKEFLIITVNEKAAIAAAEAGVKIAGLEFTEKVSVAIGTRRSF